MRESYLKIPLVAEVAGDDLTKELAKRLVEEKKKNGTHGIRYFGLRYARIIMENNISLQKICTEALALDSSFGNNYHVELDKGIGIYKLAKENNYEKNEETIFSLQPLILYGPPGTGKTYEMQTKYCAAYKEKPNDLFITTFHQSFSYEEFVEGLKPFVPEGKSEVQYRIEPGVFYLACEQAAKLAGYMSLAECIADESNRKDKIQDAIKNNKVVLLCIDEINRANVSSVFGDLISLVESSKRLGAEYEMTAKLPYSKKDFGVPANLMIVGTMNTADRSIQLLDSALRRRFKFVELLPDYKCLHDKNENEIAEKILRNINNRIRALLDKDHQIGHSYFIGKNTNLEILNVMKENIIPLLEEYFYNETDKIRVVLNETDDLLNEDNAKKHKTDYFYVIDKEATDAIKNTSDFDDDKVIYKLNNSLSEVKEDAGAEVFLTHLIQEQKSNSKQGEE
ncbi:MAG: AAA family ATPase [Treponema sp.]|nr:AAA family ATPase [Treponema sp.]